MPRATLSDSAMASLDTEAIRQLVSRQEFAMLLWKEPVRQEMENAFSALHGSRAPKISAAISKQVLCTFLKALHACFTGLPETKELGERKALQAEELVRLCVHLEFDDDYLDAPMQVCLLTVLIHASASILLHAGQDLNIKYRSIIDLVREGFESTDHVVSNLINVAGNFIKTVTKDLFEASRTSRRSSRLKAASKKCSGMRELFPPTALLSSLQEQISRISADLPELWMRVMRVQQKFQKGHRAGHKMPREGTRSNPKKEAVPDFFSDADGSEIEEGDDFESDHPHVMSVSDPDVDDTQSPDKVSQPPAMNAVKEGRQKRRSRKRVRSKRVLQRGRNSVSSEESSVTTSETGSEKFRKKTRTLSYKDCSEGSSPLDSSYLNGMDSSQFPGTDEEDDDDDEDGEDDDNLYIARQTGSKRQVREPLPRETNGACARVRQEAQSDSGSDEADNPEKDDADRAAILGTAGATVRDLHELASKLGASGVVDPLAEAHQDAKRAKRRNRRSRIELDHPTADARLASPIPDTGSSIRRRPRTRLQHLTQGSSSPESVRKPPEFHGKILRTGRFQPYEDELLIGGLRQYGWGSWTDIAKNFGDGKYTRNPMSLKDRCRTLELDPEKYPLTGPSHRRPGRPRKQLKLQSKVTEVEEDVSEDKIQSPGRSTGNEAVD